MTRTTIVIPCFNEARRLPARRFRAFARARREVGLLFVNDGSTDETLALLDDLASSLPDRIAVLDLPHNCGKAEAVRRGVLAAIDDGSHYVGYLDADLATPLNELPRFIDVLDRRADIDIVIGTRIGLLGRQIDRQRSRDLLGRLFAMVASRTIGIPLYDTQCGAKLFRVSADTAALFAEPFGSRWIFDVELFARLIVRCRDAMQSSREECRLSAESPPPWPSRAKGEGNARIVRELISALVYELPLEQWQDVAGSKLRSKDYARAAFELAHIYWRYFVRGASAGQFDAAAAHEPIAGPNRKSSGPASIQQPPRQRRHAA